ncbi:hypothetical protein BDB00DRAFT_410117 [Zychaea mexicana]|uniref:uncharacterized protein n=1 Tax=Zychaea mexicana TaxID=64656 RepID=UPI0022FDD6E1|nr:uncharacterized protein BDB00DRAFT_410117 [Zychaea mexicana]KAI9492988.1 hypothetical protein BDB00DRAFT_410117 [Zychaea mexicana]
MAPNDWNLFVLFFFFNKAEIRRQVDEEVSAAHKSAMDLLIEEQERKWQAEIQGIRSDHEKALTQLEANHAKQLADAEHAFQQKLQTAGEEKEHAVQELQTRMADMEKILDDSRTVSNLRRLERQLSENRAAFDEYKRQAAQATEILERRFRDEMQQLQSGSDDTAEVWLGKNRAAQQEIDRLQAASIELEQTHAAKLQDTKDDYEEQVNDWKTKCESQESELDSQAHQIESLLTQIDDLQNSLEAATKRLERNTTKKQQQQQQLMEPSVSDEMTVHRLCEEKLQAQKQEVEELHRRVSDLKQSHETQLNRLGHEKARELQELRKEMQAVQDLLETTKTASDERLSAIAQQHKKEIHVMHEQYQKLVEFKDRELEDYSYRVKALAAAKQKEMDRVREETNEKIGEIEGQIEGYEVSFLLSTSISQLLPFLFGESWKETQGSEPGFFICISFSASFPISSFVLDLLGGFL